MLFLLKSSIILAGLYLFYKLLLERESFFFANRVYLLACLLLGVSLPFVSLPPLIEQQGLVDQWVVSKTTATPNQPVIRLTTGNEGGPAKTELTPTTEAIPEVANAPAEVGPQKQSLHWLWYLYGFGVLVFGINFLAQIISVLWKAYRTDDKIVSDEGTIVNLTGEVAPCSFFRFIFINPTAYDFETYEQILAHEQIHVRQWHSVDLLLSELLVVLCWFNPFAWLLRQAIEKNQEYQTDHLLLQQGTAAKQTYQLNLVKIASYTRPLTVTTNYNQSMIKQRILKMNSKRSNPFNYWKYAFVLPFLLLLVLGLNAPTNVQARTPVDILPEATNKTTITETKTSTTTTTETTHSADDTPEQATEGRTSQTAKSSADIPPTDTLAKADTDDMHPNCKALKQALNNRNIPELRRILTYDDIGCLDDIYGQPSTHIDMMQGLLQAGAMMDVGPDDVIRISDLAFTIVAKHAQTNDCTDKNYLKLSLAIREKDEYTIRKVLSETDLTCPLNTDGVTNDFKLIKEMMAYHPAISFQENNAITIYGIGFAVDLDREANMEDYERQIAEMNHPDYTPKFEGEFSCQDLLQAIQERDIATATNIAQRINPNCSHKITRTTTVGQETFSTTSIHTPLIDAILREQVGLVRTLLANNADPNFSAEGPMTPLMYAAQVGNVAVVQTLITAGAELNKEDEQGVTALEYAKMFNQTIVQKYLISQGAKSKF